MIFIENAMLAQLTLSHNLPNAKPRLLICPKSTVLPEDLPHGERLKSVLARRDMKISALAKTPVSANIADGALVVWAMLDFDQDTYALQVQLRKALQLLLDEHPKEIAIVVS